MIWEQKRGEFLSKKHDQETIELTTELFKKDPDSFRNKLASVLINLTDEQLMFLADLTEKLADRSSHYRLHESRLMTKNAHAGTIHRKVKNVQNHIF